MTKKTMAATGLFAAISVAGAVGLLMSGGTTTPRRLIKRASAMMERTGEQMQNILHIKGKG